MKLQITITSLLLLTLGLTTVTAEHINAHTKKRLGTKNQIITFEPEHEFNYDHSLWDNNLVATEKTRIERDAKL